MTFDFDRGSAAPVLAATCANSSWYLVYTRPRLEVVTRQNLQQQGFEAYLPLYKRLKKTEAGTEIIFEPMFARYVFFRPSRDFQSISPAHSTRGVAHLVRFGTEMATVRPDTLNAIRQFEFSGDLKPAKVKEVLRCLDEDLADGTLLHQGLDWTGTLRHAEHTGENHTRNTGVRAMDLFHVAAALDLRAELFLTFDDRQLTTARAAGLKAVLPKATR